MLRCGEDSFADVRGRTTLVAKARWLLLALIGAYGLCTLAFYSLSSHSLFLSPLQLLCLGGCVAAVLGYNILYHFHYEAIHRLRYVDHLQLLLDLFFVTVLVHFSGGAASWFWAVYLLVTLEASILLQEKGEVWLLGTLGGLLYGTLLILEFQGTLTHVRMPFVEEGLNREPLYLVLHWLWVSLLNAAVAMAGAALMAVIRRERRAVVESEEQKAAFLESAHDLIFSCTPEGNFSYVNKAWEQALGYELSELSGMTLLDVIAGENRNKCIVEFRKALRGEKVGALEGSLVARNGCHISVEGTFSCTSEGGRPTVIWGVCRDITARKEAQEQLYHLAHHDMLTDLPNRLTFTDRLIQAKAMAKRLDRKVAVLFLDLDRFKVINDTLGHAVGDMMLQETANRLSSCVREIDTVSRFGGDEFVILLSNLHSAESSEKVSSKILKCLGQPMQIDGHELFITTSIGISVYPDDAREPEDLLKKADVAMYQAKAQGRNNRQFYCMKMDLNAERRLILESGLRRAVERKEFYLLYQPKVDIGSGRITALEALARWNHPELGMIPPADFISLAEESGLIIPLGEWVLREACRQNLAWQAEGLPPVRVAVNLSGFQLEQKDFVERVGAVLEETGLEGRYLELEVTETVIMQKPDFAVMVLNRLRDMEIHISIDDFGTGYSSLAHLKRFSVNTLKIDKSFVRDVEQNSTDAAIASAIIAMGKSMNLQVIAEGVETEGQLDFLRGEECHEMQGYLFSRPVPAEEIAGLLGEKEDRDNVA